MKIGLITDGNADIPQNFVEKYDLGVVMAKVIIDGVELIDGETISREEYYNRLPDLDPPPTTAAPAPGEFIAAYQRHFEKGYDHLVTVLTSARLSATFESANIAAQQYPAKVTVLDSEQLSLGIGYQVLAAAEAIEGGAALEEVVHVIEDTRSRITVYALLDTLVQAKRSGRISWLRAGMGEMLKVKVFIKVEGGELVPAEQVRTTKRSLARLQQLIEELEPLEKIALLHTNTPELAQQLAEGLNIDGPAERPVINIAPAVGTHVGKNGLGFAAVRSKN